jgi:membrane protein DedA with SNARE-associated domain
MALASRSPRLSPRPFRGRRAQNTPSGSIARRRREADVDVTARFIPGGRTATAFTCGLTAYAWRRFLVFTLIAGTIWASYAGLLGYFGGKTFEDQPWKGLLVAFAIAGTITVTIEVVRHLREKN